MCRHINRGVQRSWALAVCTPLAELTKEVSLVARAARSGGASPRALFFLIPPVCLPALMTVCLSSVRGNKEEHAMPALETKETQMPRSALRHRPLREADTPGPAPLYRRASRVQGSVETQPRADRSTGDASSQQAASASPAVPRPGHDRHVRALAAALACRLLVEHHDG